MRGRRNPFVAVEGIPVIGLVLVLMWVGTVYVHVATLLPLAALLAFLWFIFRDPRRRVPAVPLGVVSPVDGVIEAIDLTDRGVSQGEAHRLVFRIDSFGTYTARCPVEGMIKDLNALAQDRAYDFPTNALWVRTDEGDDVVLQFGGYRFGLPPRALLRYGERVGQGQRCAYLRLTRTAEVHLPLESQIVVKPGDRVAAGTDVVARLPHP